MKNVLDSSLIDLSSSLTAQTFTLEKGQATYMVKYLFKRVEGTSKELKGKIECQENKCEFLIAVNVASFLSSDSHRDLNMQTTVEASRYPVALAKGTFHLSDWNKKKSTFVAEIEFHGVKKKYDLSINSKGPLHKEVDLLLDLEAHKIERPSLFTAKIKNEVPVHFDLIWRSANET